MVKLSDAFKYNGTPSLRKFSELQVQCKNTGYFTFNRPISSLSSWESYQCISYVNLSSNTISSSGGQITVSYNIPYRENVTPTILPSIGNILRIVPTDQNGDGFAEITIDSNESDVDKNITIDVLISPGNVETKKTAHVTQYADTVLSDWEIVSYGTPVILYEETGLTPGNSSINFEYNCTNTWKRVWSSGREEVEERTVLPEVSIDQQYYSSSESATNGTNITRFSLTGTSLQHSTMGTTTGYDYVVIKAVNPNNYNKTTTESFNVRNKIESYNMSYYVNTTAGATSSGSTCTFEADLTSPADYIVVYGNCDTTLTTGATSKASSICNITTYPVWASLSGSNNILYVTDNTGPERSEVINIQVSAYINGVYESKYFTLTIVQRGTGGQRFVGVLPMSITTLSGSSWELKSNETTVLTGGSSDMSISQSTYYTYINFNKIVDYIKSDSYNSSYILKFTYYDGPYPTYFSLSITSSNVSSIKAGNDFEGYFYDSYY